MVTLGMVALASAALAQLDDHAIVALEARALHAAVTSGRLSAEQVTRAYLRRIAALDDAGPALRAVIEVNPDAEAIARALDERLGRGDVPGPLHGVPVLVKASIDTADRMVTSAGSIALAEHRAAEDAPIVARLRAAGAVLLGKSNLSEWANFRSTDSTSGWSSLGGQTRNPYVLDRNPCGSSSGAAVAVAARLAPLSVGTETDGSIVCPAAANGVVGIKPAIGTVSRRGIVPIARSQDTAGPFARTVADAALLLSVLVDDGVTAPVPGPAAAVAGLRIGVVRDFGGAGADTEVEASFAATLERLAASGAQLVDPVRIGWGPAVARAELTILVAEFRDGLDAYLAGVRSAPGSLEELIAFNTEHAGSVMPHFGQELFLAAHASEGTRSREYRAAQGTVFAARAALAGLFSAHALDALIAPANARAWRTDYAAGDALGVSSSRIAAVTGFPSVAVPTELVGELPLGVALVSLPGHESALLTIAAAVELARRPFPPPRFVTSVAR
jgi:amidase